MNTIALRKVILATGLFLIGISLYCSFLLYTSFSPRLTDKAAWGGMGLGLDTFKNIALLAGLALWSLGFFAARILAVVVTLAYVLLTVLSFMAFFGFMATVQHKLETQNLHDGARYRSLQGALENAEQKVTALSRHADPAQVQDAQNRLRGLQRRIDDVHQGMARYAHADCTPKRNHKGLPYTTRAAEWCARLRSAEAEAAPWQAVIAGHQAYQAALAHRQQALDDLARLDAGDITGATPVHPMFADLGKLLSLAPDEAKVAFMFISSASAEILGTLSILIAALLGRKRSFSLDEIEHLSTELRAQQIRLQTALGMAPQFAAVPPVPAGGGFLPRSANGADQEKFTHLSIHAPATGLQAAGQRYLEMREAVLSGHCPPRAADLIQRYNVPPAQAEACLAELAAQGYLETHRGEYRLRPSAPMAEGSLCDAVEYRHGADPIQIFFPHDHAALPVKLRSGATRHIPWGKRDHENLGLPEGGWAPLETIRAGQWQAYQPRPVIIPVHGYLENNPAGNRHWFHLPPQAAIQGLLAGSAGTQRIYIVTVPHAPVEVAAEHVCLHDRWPRVVSVG